MTELQLPPASSVPVWKRTSDKEASEEDEGAERRDSAIAHAALDLTGILIHALPQQFGRLNKVSFMEETQQGGGSYWTMGCCTSPEPIKPALNVVWIFSSSSLVFKIKSRCNYFLFSFNTFLSCKAGLQPFPDSTVLILTCSLLIFLPAGKYF